MDPCDTMSLFVRRSLRGCVEGTAWCRFTAVCQVAFWPVCPFSFSALMTSFIFFVCVHSIGTVRHQTLGQSAPSIEP